MTEVVVHIEMRTNTWPGKRDELRKCQLGTPAPSAAVVADHRVANVSHQQLALKHTLIQNTNTSYYNYAPQTILENTRHMLYCDRAIFTDKTIHYNRRDMTLQDKINKVNYLIDIAVLSTHNIQKANTENIRKYAELKDEATRIWRQEKYTWFP